MPDGSGDGRNQAAYKGHFAYCRTRQAIGEMSALDFRSAYCMANQAIALMPAHLRGKCTRSHSSDPAAVNSICTLHVHKYIPKIIAVHSHAFLTFGFQKGDFAGFLFQYILARANFGNGAKSRETNIRNGFSIVESLGIHCFRAFRWKKFLAQKYQGGVAAPWYSGKFVFMEKRENSGFLCFRLC